MSTVNSHLKKQRAIVDNLPTMDDTEIDDHFNSLIDSTEDYPVQRLLNSEKEIERNKKSHRLDSLSINTMTDTITTEEV